MTRIIAGDPDNDAWKTTTVIFNGNELRYCVYADDETGTVLYNEAIETPPGEWHLKQCVCACGNHHPVAREAVGTVEFISISGAR